MSLHLLALATIVAAQPAAAEMRLSVSLDLEKIRVLPVQHDGRWPPLDTVARDTVETVTGSAFFEGHDPVLWLLAWTFAPETWREAPLIRIPQAELRAELELPSSQTVFSCAELLGHRPLVEQVRALSQRESGGKLNPLEAKVSDIQEKLTVLQGVFHGQAIRPIPDPEDLVGALRPIQTASPHGGSEAGTAAVVRRACAVPVLTVP